MKKSLAILNNSLTTVIVQAGVEVGEYVSLPANSGNSSKATAHFVDVRPRRYSLQQKLLSVAIGVYHEHANLGFA